VAESDGIFQQAFGGMKGSPIGEQDIFFLPNQ